ncbi:hypothetical protein QQP08_022702, partial [Theobroma cacao]
SKSVQNNIYSKIHDAEFALAFCDSLFVADWPYISCGFNPFCPQQNSYIYHLKAPTSASLPKFPIRQLLFFSSSYPRRLAVSLLRLQFVKVEGVSFESSFMSERASLFLSSIGLLGEYCPTSRKRIEVPPLKLSACILRPITHTVLVAILRDLFQVKESCLVKEDFSPQFKTPASDLCPF